MINKLLQAVIFLFFSANTFAHALHITAQYDGVAISGKAYYSDQTPAVDTYVEAVKLGEADPVVYGKPTVKDDSICRLIKRAHSM